jgi:hypothetical protein
MDVLNGDSKTLQNRYFGVISFKDSYANHLAYRPKASVSCSIRCALYPWPHCADLKPGEQFMTVDDFLSGSPRDYTTEAYGRVTATYKRRSPSMPWTGELNIDAATTKKRCGKLGVFIFSEPEARNFFRDTECVAVGDLHVVA